MAAFISYLFLSTPSEMVLCRGNADCFREWLTTLGTLFAVVAAAVGSYFVYGQLEAQRKQTAFMLGDGQPTLEFVRRSQRTFSGTFRIINWNRRMLVVSKVTINSPVPFSSPVGVRRLRFTKPEDVCAADFILPSKEVAGAMVRVPGWLDRQQSPYAIPFVLLFKDRQLGPPQDIGEGIPATLEVEVFFTGSADKPFKLKVTGELADFLPTTRERESFYHPIERPKKGAA